MKFEQYRLFTKVTMKEFDSQIMNSLHMTVGMATEVLSELPIAIETNDIVNAGEEIGDIFWYLANYANVWNIESADIEIDTYGVDESLSMVSKTIGDILDLDKKEFAYGKIANLKERVRLFKSLHYKTEVLCDSLGLDSDVVRKKNIMKLNARYGGKFTEAAAINRDLEKELEILSN